MVLAVDKRLQQQRFEAVALAEVGGQALQAQGEGLGSEVAAGGGGPDQEAREARDVLQPAAAGGVVPADPAVAVGELQGGRGEADGTEDAVVGEQQVA